MIADSLQKLGRRMLDRFSRVGRGSLFLWQCLVSMPYIAKKPMLLIRQV